MEAVAPDRRLADRYVLEELIATGGMAEVWRGRDEVLARRVAVKILRSDLAGDPDVAERFQREAIAAARLTHPSIISVYDTGLEDGTRYIVMEHFAGPSLRNVLDQRGWLPAAESVAIVLPVLDALAYAHESGLVHRDVKPGNVLVGDGGRPVKVTDFGIAKAAFAGGKLTTTGSLLGTVRYISPEQVEGREVDARSDLYSAGAVMYETLTGRPPFEGPNDVATAMMRLTTDPLPPRAGRPERGHWRDRWPRSDPGGGGPRLRSRGCRPHGEPGAGSSRHRRRPRHRMEDRPLQHRRLRAPEGRRGTLDRPRPRPRGLPHPDQELHPGLELRAPIRSARPPLRTAGIQGRHHLLSNELRAGEHRLEAGPDAGTAHLDHPARARCGAIRCRGGRGRGPGTGVSAPQGPDPADAELVRRARGGDEQAVARLMQRHERRVYNLAYRMLGNAEDARDATQDAFLSCFRHLDRFRGESQFATWLHRIAINACYDSLRRRHDTKSLDDEPFEIH